MTKKAYHNTFPGITAALALAIVLCSCGNNSATEKKTTTTSSTATAAPAPAATTKTGAPAPASATPDITTTPDKIVNDAEIPILCYHQIRDWTAKDSKFQKTFIVPVATFKEQIKILHDSGYHAILPDELIEHMATGKALPSKPIMLTFDDGPESQIQNALPELDKAGFKATFYIMTVVLGHNNYMTKAQVAQLAQQGHVVGCHTWNHQMVTKYKTDADYVTQIQKPKADLEKIVGKPVKYFAYPDGIWNEAAISYIKKCGYVAAFSLFKRDPDNRYFTLRRLITDPYWTGPKLLQNIRHYQQ